ncbi:hypothetical protein KP509_05G057300 [Ceratopteris richardii]|uniref:Uncharacterized protein n=1 Tax=Ceratopteris richardii TaxID=49495 RepID=A0A8T2UYJ0_CERRI|nr:hypothetical protein KP509_05G057300 [Ceratopteris richardii]
MAISNGSDHENGENSIAPSLQTEGAAVEVMDTIMVRPTKPTCRHLMYMSGVDQILAAAGPSRTILFYRGQVDSTAAVKRLEHAIASVLVPYYPMAGRLARDENGRIAIDCNDEGVQIIHARCDLSITDLQGKGFAIQPYFRQLVPMDHLQSSDSSDDALASFQVTAFKDGITLGIAVAHSVADGVAMWNFIKAVSETSRSQPLSIYPLHARYLLKPSVFIPHTVFLSPDSEEGTKTAKVAPYNGCEEPRRESNTNREVLQQRVIHFSREMLDILKKECLNTISNTKAGDFVTSFQALGAYLWKRLAMAQNLDGETGVDFRVAMDVRSRMIPPLTLAFFGNAVVGVPTPSTAGELVTESLGATCARIRRSINQVDDDYIKRALIDRENKDLRKIALSNVQVLTLRNGTGFHVFEAAEFGWGQPEAVRPPFEHREGEMTLYPGKEAKSIDVIVALSEATCKNFFSENLYPNDPLQNSPLLLPA